MKNKQDRFYFENFIAASDDTCSAADYLVKCLKNYDADKMRDMLKTMHQFEHAGDTKKHEMSASLAKAFVTPIDREDLAVISQCIDDVTDCIEEILQCFYTYQITAVLPEAIAFAEKLVGSCALMKKMLTEFGNFKKPAKLHEMIVEMNHFEEECDGMYLEAMRKIRTHTNDVLEIISWREIYEKMEDCADACEHVGDCVDTVVMKNT
ncbi:MAG: DUF47 domain-containing protein [Candidatus Fimenecus sp.]